MADDNSQRPLRTTDYSRAPAKGGHANDPLAELARLIGQNDPFAEFGRKQQAPAAPAQSVPQQDQWAPQPYAAPGPDAFQPAGYDSEQLYQDDSYRAGGDDYDDVPPPRRRWSIIGIAAVVALAVVGTAGAVGYRALFGSSGNAPPPVIKAETTPTKVVPANKAQPQSSKLIYDRVGERSSGEKLVSREEQPLDISKSTQAGVFPSAIPMGQPAAATAGNAGTASVDQPKKIRTIVIRPDQQGAAEPNPQPVRAAAVAPPAPTPPPAPAAAPRAAPPQRLASAPPIATSDAAAETAPARPAPPPPARQAAPSRSAPLSLSPNAVASAPPEPVRTASAPATRAAPAPASAGGQYAVQISSQRSEEDAQAAFRALQAKYPAQLSGRQPLIRRADLGSKGIYYRAMVGPFATQSDASELCQSLKAAGAGCLIQKN